MNSRHGRGSRSDGSGVKYSSSVIIVAGSYHLAKHHRSPGRSRRRVLGSWGRRSGDCLQSRLLRARGESRIRTPYRACPDRFFFGSGLQAVPAANGAASFFWRSFVFLGWEDSGKTGKSAEKNRENESKIKDLAKPLNPKRESFETIYGRPIDGPSLSTAE
jgi:hypothetical protein